MQRLARIPRTIAGNFHALFLEPIGIFMITLAVLIVVLAYTWTTGFVIPTVQHIF